MWTIIIKNIIGLMLIAWAHHYMGVLRDVITSENAQNTMFLFVGLMLGGALVTNFTFSYSSTDMRNRMHVITAHIITFFSMLLVGLILVAMDVLMSMVVGDVLILRLILVMFYVTLILYDYWDFIRKDTVYIAKDK